MHTNQLKNNRGLVHVYTGDGKGKTTAALGLALRAIGWGARVCMVQFIKGYAEIGEAKFARQYPDQFVLRQFTVDRSRNIDEAKALGRQEDANEALKYAAQVVSGGEFEVVILDEINNAMHYNLVSVESVLQIIRDKPEHVELILTGRSAPDAIMQAADYVTLMQMSKHPYMQNIGARPGIDY